MQSADSEYMRHNLDSLIAEQLTKNLAVKNPSRRTCTDVLFKWPSWP